MDSNVVMIIHLRKKSNFAINIFELNFYQDQYKWKLKLLPIEINKNVQDRVIDLIIHQNHYVLIKKLPMFLGNHNCIFVCRRCLNSYTSQNIMIKHKQQCGEQDITSLRLCNEPHLYWKKKCFQKNPLYFRIYAHFKADNEIENSFIGNKTTENYK